MLAIVEHQQHHLVAEEPHQRVRGGAARLIGQAKCARDGQRCHCRVGDRCKIDVPDPLGEFGHELRRDFDGKPGLSRTASTRQSDKPLAADHLAEFGHLGLPPYKTRQLGGQVVRRGSLADAKRWKLVVQVGMAQLHDALRTRQVAQRIAT